MRLVLIIFLTLPLTHSVIPLQKENKIYAANHKNAAQDNKKASENGASDGQSKPFENTTRIECKCANENSPDYKTAGFWVNTVLAVGTIIIAIFSVIMGNASRKGARVAEQTLKLLAADIQIDAAGLSPPGQMTPESYIVLRLKNFGETKAEKVRSFIVVKIPGCADSEFSPETFEMAKGAEQLVRFREFRQFLTSGTFGQIINGTIVVKISGTVTYVDVFGDPHTLEVKEGILDPRKGVFNIGIQE